MNEAAPVQVGRTDRRPETASAIRRRPDPVNAGRCPAMPAYRLDAAGARRRAGQRADLETGVCAGARSRRPAGPRWRSRSARPRFRGKCVHRPHSVSTTGDRFQRAGSLRGPRSTDHDEPGSLKRQLIGDFAHALCGLHQNSKLLFRGALRSGGAARERALRRRPRVRRIDAESGTLQRALSNNAFRY
ncbi:MAG: hypothetical protein RI906_849 [Pseudomonadota bacterium]